MKISVNGEAREIAPGTTIKKLVELEGLGAGPVAVEKNGEVVRRRDHEATALTEGDVIEIVHFVGGG